MTIWNIIIYGLYFVTGIYVLGIICLYLFSKTEFEIFNNGIAPSGNKWELYHIDCKGIRYYKDPKGNSLCKLIYTEE